MALTKNERRALELARKRIAKGEEYICCALDRVANGGDVSRADADKIIAYIENALGQGEFGTLDVWQGRNGFGDRGNDQRRADRLSWIDWMLGSRCRVRWCGWSGNAQSTQSLSHSPSKSTPAVSRIIVTARSVPFTPDH